MDDEFCEICDEDISGGESHYHCSNCGEVTSAMGHYNPVTKDFTCHDGAVPELPHEFVSKDFHYATACKICGKPKRAGVHFMPNTPEQGF